jgi:hypothetical protein
VHSLVRSFAPASLSRGTLPPAFAPTAMTLGAPQTVDVFIEMSVSTSGANDHLGGAAWHAYQVAMDGSKKKSKADLHDAHNKCGLIRASSYKKWSASPLPSRALLTNPIARSPRTSSLFLATRHAPLWP